MKKHILFGIICCFAVFYLTAGDKNLVIDSPILGTKTKIEVFHLGAAESITSIMYFTDGEKLLKAGFMERLQTLFKAGKIPPVYLAFVSSVDLKDNIDKRNTYFFCNPDYLDFFEKEVLPQTEQLIGKSFISANRTLVGISFGGLNGAWFSAKSNAFQNYALLSPVTYPCKTVIADISFSQNERLNIYISTGVNDAENYVGPLQSIYKSKGYNIHSEKTAGGHDFENWAGQLETLFTFFYHPK
ncbi:alpha/beta hydrolase-fold protein [Flagellimonas sp.]|uniref:alpha/beta hydrolase-fold protein n=1 Tax=Flagellimonas sp. TaxID=2058762 RepID=UPI003F4A1635